MVPLKKEKTHFTVRLTELKAADKVKLIKEVKNFVPGINLVQVRRGLPEAPPPRAGSHARDKRQPPVSVQKGSRIPVHGTVCPGCPHAWLQRRGRDAEQGSAASPGGFLRRLFPASSAAWPTAEPLAGAVG